MSKPLVKLDGTFRCLECGDIIEREELAGPKEKTILVWCPTCQIGFEGLTFGDSRTIRHL